MTQQGNEYRADKGKTFVEIISRQDMGVIICIGKGDSIDNYEEVEIVEKTEDENENSI